jgi:hypothetical protein
MLPPGKRRRNLDLLTHRGNTNYIASMFHVSALAMMTKVDYVLHNLQESTSSLERH